MALIIWSGAESPLLTKTFEAVLRSFKPDIPQHHFLPWDDEQQLPEPLLGDVLLACGKKPLATMQRAGIAPKNRTPTSLREKPIKRASGGHFMITHDPLLTQVEYDKLEVIEWDTRLAVRLMRTGSLLPQIGKYRWVNSFQPLIDRVEQKFAASGKPVDVSMDTETMGLYPWYPDRDIVSISFTVDAGKSDLLYLQPGKVPLASDPTVCLFDQITWLLTSPKVRLRGANLKYDLIWIIEKWGIACTNFKFDTLLVGTILNENRSNSLNLHAKVYTVLGGYDDCVLPETKLLTADLRWVEAGSIVPGQELVGFDEEVPTFKCRRKLSISIAVSTKRIVKRCSRIHLSNGQSITCSWDHGFLGSKYDVGGFLWYRARQLYVGDRIKLVAPFVEQGTTYDDGWMGGFLDGEGFCCKNHVQASGSFCLGWTQLAGPIHDRAVASMKNITTYGGYTNDKEVEGLRPVLTTKFTQWPSLHAMMRFRPERLIAKRAWVGASIPTEPEQARITEIEYLGMQEVVSLQTSTRTFVAEGLASHNSFNAKYDKGKMETVPLDDLLTYAGGDTDSCQQVADIMREELGADDALTRFYVTILHPGARAFEKIERRGILIDQEKYAVLGEDLRKVIKIEQNKALSLLPNKMLCKYKDRIEEQIADGKNPLLPSILSEYFFTPHGLNLKPKEKTPKTGAPSMKKSHLRQFADHPAAAEMLKSLTIGDTASKTLSTFVEGFLRHLRPDGRLHPSYMLFHGGFQDDEDDESGSVTGRLSAREPAIQTLSKKAPKVGENWAKRLRLCFPAPLGKVVLSIDYSQGELKIVACIAPEKTMLAAYEQGLDLHAVTGAKLGLVTLEEFLTWKDNKDKVLADKFDDLRARSKPANFGLVYGMQAEGFRAYAWANYGVKLSLAEAEEMRAAFFQLYPGLLNFHEHQREVVKFTEQVRSPLGRVRHLPMIKSWDRETKSKASRQAINSPVQSCLTDMMIWAISLIEDAYPGGEIEIVAMIHDALIAYVPENEVALWASRVVQLMSHLPFHEVGWSPQLQFTADAEAGPNLASLTKLKLAA